MVSYQDVAQAKRPDKKVYSITDAGRAQLAAALAETPPRHKVRSEFLVLMYFAHLMTAERLAEVLDERVRNIDRLLECIDNAFADHGRGPRATLAQPRPDCGPRPSHPESPARLHPREPRSLGRFRACRRGVAFQRRLTNSGEQEPDRSIMVQVSAIALLGAVLTGCAIMGGLSEPPLVSLVGITPVDVQLFEQRFRVTLRVQNPNSQDITIRGLDYEIIVNDRLFAPAEVEVVSTFQRVMEQLRELGVRGKPSIDYAIRGHVSVDGIPIPVPFEYADTLTLPGFEEHEKKDGGGRLPRPKAIAI
jgi:hypothetical protein